MLWGLYFKVSTPLGFVSFQNMENKFHTYKEKFYFNNNQFLPLLYFIFFQSPLEVSSYNLWNVNFFVILERAYVVSSTVITGILYESNNYDFWSECGRRWPRNLNDRN